MEAGLKILGTKSEIFSQNSREIFQLRVQSKFLTGLGKEFFIDDNNKRILYIIALKGIVTTHYAKMAMPDSRGILETGDMETPQHGNA